VAFGLPISVAVGWTLAAPQRRPASIGAPAGAGGLGAGGIGAAPGRATRQPVAQVEYSSQPPRPGLSPGAPVAASVPSAAGVVPSAAAPAPTATTSEPALPELTLPPVPTPTEIPDDPSASTTPTAVEESGQPPAP
jgi:hypothetical protein